MRDGSSHSAPTLVADTRDATGESPLWCPDRAGLVWTDIPGRRLHHLDPVRGAVRTWRSDAAVGSLAQAADGGFVAAVEHGFARLHLGDGDSATLESIAPVLAHDAALRFNDGRCDRQGRFWASSMAWEPDSRHPAGTLWRLDRGEARAMLGGLVIGNGLAWSPDGRTMYLSESDGEKAGVRAFDFDPDEGVPHGGRPFIDFRGSGGRPDGAAIDTDGCYWIAVADAGLVQRYTPAGVLDLSIALPVSQPTMPAFGGPDLRTLYVASLRPPDTPLHLPDGGVFAIDVAHQGLPEPLYRP